MFFDSWFGLIRVIVVGGLAYLALICCCASLATERSQKWNAFDFVVTVTLGSTLANVLLSKDVALVEGVFAFLVLIGLQYIVTSLASDTQRFAARRYAGPGSEKQTHKSARMRSCSVSQQSWFKMRFK